MLMRYPTEKDLRMSLPQTPPAYMALMPSFLSFILHFPLSLCCSLLSSPIIDLQKPRTFPEFLSVHPCLSLSHYLSLPVYFPVHLLLPLFLFLHPLLSLLFFLISQPIPPTRHLSQQSMPFHSGEWTNGIPAESAAAGSEQRLFCDADSPCPPLTLQQRPFPGPYHLFTHIHKTCRTRRSTLLPFTEWGAVSAS